MPITSQTLDVSNTSIVTFYEFANNANRVVSDLHFLRGQANSTLANTNAYIATKLDSSSLDILTVNHVRTANTGSASLPTYSFTGDVNTGMWRSAADTIAFTTGGTNRLVVNTSLITTSLTFTPSSDDGAALGSASLKWSDLYLASGGVINFNNGDINITGLPNQLFFSGAASGYVFDNSILPSFGGNLGGGLNQFSNLYLASSGSVNFGNGDVTITAGSNTLQFAGASNGYLFDSHIHAFATNLTLGTLLSPFKSLILDNAGSINFDNSDVTVTHGTNSLAFAGASSGYSFDNKLYFTSGGGFDFNSGDVTITHSANTINFTGATAGYVFNNGPITATNANTNLSYSDNGAGGGPNLYLYRNSLTPATSDKIGAIWFDGRNSSLGRVTYSMIDTTINTATAASERATMTFSVASGGSLPGVMELTANGIYMPIGGIILDGGPLIVDGTTTLNGLAQFGGAGYGRLTSYIGSPISTLVPGTTAGGLIEGSNNGHLVFGIRDNDGGDSVSIVSYNGTGAYSRSVMNARADGLINIFGQIGFPASVNLSSGANVLDDYEEGSFSPTLRGETTNPTSVTYDSNFNDARYVKIGRTVFIHGRMRTTAVTVGSMAGAIAIGGLPFAASSSHGAGGSAINVGFRSGWTGAVQPDAGFIFSSVLSGLAIRLYFNASATASASMAATNVSATVNDASFLGWYITDS